MFEMTTIVVDNDKTTTEANDTQRGLVYDSDRLPHVIEEEASGKRVQDHFLQFG